MKANRWVEARKSSAGSREIGKSLEAIKFLREMCHFITGLIDKKISLDDLNEAGHDNAIAFDKCDNDFVKSQLKANEDYLVKRTKFCDCETQLGLMTRTSTPDTLLKMDEDVIYEVQR